MLIKHGCFEHLFWRVILPHSILDSQLSWESGKFQLARRSHRVALFSNLDPDLQVIISLLGTWLIDPNPTSKSSKKWPQLAKIYPKLFKIGQNQSKNPKSVGVTLKILLMPKSAGYIFQILLLVSKPTGHEVPRCRNNLQLWMAVHALIAKIATMAVTQIYVCFIR